VKQRFYLGGGALWMRCKLQLAGVYRKMGRTSDAAKLERELRKLLAYADPDHPILLALQRH
jgi:GH15 family glucan-1,4-alpha-glucosidase